MKNVSFLFYTVIIAMLILVNTYSAQSSSYTDSDVQLVCSGFNFVEGPVWKDGALYFSDIPGDKVYRWTPETGKTVFLSSSGKSNGLAFDSTGHLLLAQHAFGQIARLEDDGSFTPLVTHYDGKRINSPNDLCVKSDGSVFFTDPYNGLADQNRQSELGYQGVFRLSPYGQVQLLDKTLTNPNGLTFSHDESKLYVTDSQLNKIYVYDVVNDSTIANRKLFASLPGHWADGLKTNSEGMIFSSGPYGIWVFDSTGTVLDTIRVKGQTANCAWGNEDGKTLYITSGDAVYRYKPNTTSTSDNLPNQNLNESFELFNNYPNPFNPSTNISFYIADAGDYSLKVYDILGKTITTLLENQLSPGNYSVMFDANNLSNNVYFYELSGINKKTVKKMILMK